MKHNRLQDNNDAQNMNNIKTVILIPPGSLQSVGPALQQQYK